MWLYVTASTSLYLLALLWCFAWIGLILYSAIHAQFYIIQGSAPGRRNKLLQNSQKSLGLDRSSCAHSSTNRRPLKKHLNCPTYSHLDVLTWHNHQHMLFLPPPFFSFKPGNPGFWPLYPISWPAWPRVLEAGQGDPGVCRSDSWEPWRRDLLWASLPGLWMDVFSPCPHTGFLWVCLSPNFPVS